MAKEKGAQGNQLDLFAPFVEIFHDLCVLLVTVVIDLGKILFKKIVHGNDELKKLDRKYLVVKKTTDNPWTLGVDLDSKREIALDSIDFSKHTLMVGASGFGKTNLMSILQEDSLRRKRPLIFFDPKGDLGALEAFQKVCSKYNSKCYIFSEHYKNSIKLNPIKEGTINQVADRIMCSFDWSEQYYRDMSKRSLVQALKYMEQKEIHRNIANLTETLNKKFASKENLSLISKLESINDSDFGKVLSGDGEEITFSQIRDERASLYLGLSTQGYGETAKAVGKIFLEELLYNSYITLSDPNRRNDAKENPISVYFDEFGSIVTSKFIELQNKCRGAGIELTMAVQTVADLDRIETSLTRQVMNNAMNLFVFKQLHTEDSNLLSQTIGTITTKKITYVTEDGREQSRGSAREVNEFIAHADIIKQLGIGQCIFLTFAPSRVYLLNVRLRREMAKTDRKTSKKKLVVS